MPSNYTTNYQLNQWAKTDRVLMSEFNADNAKIDAALASKATTAALNSVQSALSGQISGLKSTVTGQGAALELRNCRLYTGSYAGSVQTGASSPVTLTFPYKPVLVFVCSTLYSSFFLATRGQSATFRIIAPDITRNYLAWGDRTLKWSPDPNFALSNPRHQMNEAGDTYYYFALLEVE